MAVVAGALRALKLSASASLDSLDTQLALHRAHIRRLANPDPPAPDHLDEARRWSSKLADNGKVPADAGAAAGASSDEYRAGEKAGSPSFLLDVEPDIVVAESRKSSRLADAPGRTSGRHVPLVPKKSLSSKNLDTYQAAVAAPLPPSPGLEEDTMDADENVQPVAPAAAPVPVAAVPAPAKKPAMISALQAAEAAKKKQLEKEEERRKRKENLEQQRSAIQQQKQAAAASSAAPAVQPPPPVAADSGSVLRLKRAIEARQQQEEEKRRKIMGEAIMALDLLPSTQDASKPQPKIDASSSAAGQVKAAGQSTASNASIFSQPAAPTTVRSPAAKGAQAAPMLPPPPRGAEVHAPAPAAAAAAARVAATPAAPIRKPDAEAEVVTYEISPYKSGSESEEEEPAKQKKAVPPWARSDRLGPVLYSQIRQDPDLIFPDNANRSCSLQDIFGVTPRGMDYTRRGSSGCWTDDRLTWKEELKFKKVMGFSTYVSPGKTNA